MTMFMILIMGVKEKKSDLVKEFYQCLSNSMQKTSTDLILQKKLREKKQLILSRAE